MCHSLNVTTNTLQYLNIINIYMNIYNIFAYYLYSMYIFILQFTINAYKFPVSNYKLSHMVLSML